MTGNSEIGAVLSTVEKLCTNNLSKVDMNDLHSHVQGLRSVDIAKFTPVNEKFDPSPYTLHPQHSTLHRTP